MVFDLNKGEARFAFEGTLSNQTIGDLWETWEKHLERHPEASQVVLDGAKVTYLDGTGAALITQIFRVAKRHNRTVTLESFSENNQQLIDLFQADDYELGSEHQKSTSFPVEVGRATMDLVDDLRHLITFVGELTVALLLAFANPRKIRWRDVLRTMETAGLNALPVVVLIGFLIGFIMGFQGAIPMKQFGAEIFVASMIGLIMLRELGPIMCAVALAGRSGSAFAAEIGTMTVNEEISALKTFGLEPVKFLVVPRVIAAVLMTPLLTIFANLAGLFGGFLVFISLGFPPITYYYELVRWIDLSDFLSGMAKAFVFGILVASIGCLRGLQTKSGASAVGTSTTRAVVSGIVLIAIFDGIFAVVYYFLGI